jgi:NAD(P)-dependent dehydrogenase (short-subunit alcohol dehydrogenase family)
MNIHKNADGNIFSIENKLIFISGGNRGIGRAFAIGLSRQGAKVVIAARDEKSLEITSNLIRDEGNQCYYVTMDVASDKSVSGAVKWAQEISGGTIDVLINNAGITIENIKAEKWTDNDWLRVLDINLNGYFRLGKTVVKKMISTGSGKIINMSSVLGSNAVPMALSYCVSKGAINQLTRAWAVEWGRYNIQVNAVAPAYIPTDLTRANIEDKKFMKKIMFRTPLGRLGKKEDLLGIVTLLASNASNYITGAVIPVDGGWSAT